MSVCMRATLSALCLVLACQPSRAADDPKDALQGVWVAQSMESDGKAVPEEARKRMRFTFKGDKLIIRGNDDSDREQDCTYKIDATKSPKQLDITTTKDRTPLLAIYEVKGDELKVCVRHASSDEGRPTGFATKADTRLVLIVFKKAKAE
jgi:uncharacterized protein (TIGR03067 family)